METRAFAPIYGPAAPNNTQGKLIASVTVTATNASATAGTLPGSASSNGQCQIQIANKTTAWAHVQVGQVGNVLAATVAAGYPVAPGGVVVISAASEVSGMSVILDAAPGTATGVVFTRGEGL